MKGMDLSSFFATKAQAIDFSDRLSRIEADLYETDFDLESILQKSLGIERKDKFLTLLRENEVSMDKKQSLNKFFEQVRQEITTLPEATITFSIEPDQEILNSISSWFLLNLNKQVLIDTEIDESIIGGTIIKYEGKRFDASLRKEYINTIKGDTNRSSTQNDNSEKAQSHIQNKQYG